MQWLCPQCEATYGGIRPETCGSCGGRPVSDLRNQILGDRYRLDELIGTGSQGSTVWRANQVAMDRAVAVKVMEAERQVSRDRFARGARIASMLNHPHITTVHDYGETEQGNVFLVMELLEGRSLRADVADGEAMPVDRALHIASQLLRALEDAHGHSVVHRDLKPDNLFLTSRLGDAEFVKVLDFGIAKFFEEPRPGDDIGTTMDGQITRGWQLCGTPLYMAPEQISGEPVDARTDIYAVGIVIFQMLTGRVPFRAKTQAAVLSMHLRDAPPTLAESNAKSDLPPSAEALVARSLAKLPEARFQSAIEMGAAVHRIQAELGLVVDGPTDAAAWTSASTRTAPTPPAKPMRPWGWWAGAAIAAAAVAAFVFSPAPSSNGSEAPVPVVPQPAVRDAAGPTSGRVAPSARSRAVAPKRRTTRPAATTHTTPTRSVMVHLHTSPPGASVILDDEVQGQTPLTLALPSTAVHKLELNLADYDTHVVTVDPALVQPGHAFDVRIRLEPVKRGGVQGRRGGGWRARRAGPQGRGARSGDAGSGPRKAKIPLLDEPPRRPKPKVPILSD